MKKAIYILILLLFPLVGIYIEGIFKQSFTNTGHMDPVHLSALWSTG